MLGSYKRILVTGGAGFVGSHLCDELLARGKDVLVVDDLSTGKAENLPSSVEIARRNIASDDLGSVMKGIDLVFHVAAQPSTRKSVEDPLRDMRSNALGTLKVLLAAIEAGVKKVVYTSTSAVYGEPKDLPMSEEQPPEPASPYAASKLTGEHYCHVLRQLRGLPYTCLRPFKVYGTRENLDVSLDEVAQFTLATLKEKEITVNGDGNQSRDYVHARDVARAHVLAADEDRALGRTFNIGTGRETTINSLLQIIEEVTGRQPRVQHQPWPEGDIYLEYANIGHAQGVLGFSPKEDLRTGIQEIADSFRR